jgi:hypothetical protein
MHRTAPDARIRASFVATVDLAASAQATTRRSTRPPDPDVRVEDDHGSAVQRSPSGRRCRPRAGLIKAPLPPDIDPRDESGDRWIVVADFRRRIPALAAIWD